MPCTLKLSIVYALCCLSVRIAWGYRLFLFVLLKLLSLRLVSLRTLLGVSTIQGMYKRPWATCFCDVHRSNTSNRIYKPVQHTWTLTPWPSHIQSNLQRNRKTNIYTHMYNQIICTHKTSVRDPFPGTTGSQAKAPTIPKAQSILRAPRVLSVWGH